MPLRKLLIVNALLATIHSLGFIFVPSMLLDLYQISPGSGAELMGQLFGVELLVVAVICWLGKDLADTKALNAIVLANLVADLGGTVICVKAVLTGGMGPTGWLAVLIYGALSLAYLAVQFGKGAAPATR